MLAYKVAENDSKRVIVTLRIPEDALTNVGHYYAVYKETAKYRTNKAFVVKIEDENGKLYKTATSSQFLDKKLIYKAGELIEEPAFDTYLENVCAEGIHFFLNRRVAELYGLDEIQNGLYQRWYWNGQIKTQVNYVNGKEEGLFQCWYSTGYKFCEVNYVNGNFEGFYKSWHENGRRACQAYYVNGKQEGLSESWYPSGKQEETCYYRNGQKHGYYERCWESGHVICKQLYEDGKIVKIF